MAEIKKRKIVNYSIKRQMQLRLLLRFVLILLISASVTSIIFYYYSSQEVGQTFKQFHVNARTFLDFLLPAIIISFLVGVVIAVAIAVFFPIRMAGPLYRIEKDLRERVAAGDLNMKFSVRSNDEFQDLADALNDTMRSLKARIDVIREASEEVTALSNSLKAGDQASKRLSEAARKLSEAVRGFR
jgi:methyl-accepting chemotaxis protein